MQKSSASSVEHAAASGCSVVSARARDDLVQWDEIGKATKLPRRLTNSSDHQFLCVGIGVWSRQDAVFGNGYLVPPASDEHRLAR